MEIPGHSPMLSTLLGVTFLIIKGKKHTEHITSHHSSQYLSHLIGLISFMSGFTNQRINQGYSYINKPKKTDIYFLTYVHGYQTQDLINYQLQ